MVNGFYNGVAGLRVAELTQELAANNLANLETAGFKAERGFVAALDLALDGGPGAQPHVAGTGLSMTAGPVRLTGRPLDVAIDGAALLAVETAAGERYTRDGRLQVAGDGTLRTASGHAVLGTTGPLVVTGTDVRVEDDGTVVADGVEAGRLKLVEPPPGGDLRPEGHGLLASPAPLAAIDEAAGRVRAGYVESSNVDPVGGTVTLVETLRRFESLARANELLMGELTKSLFEESGRPLGR